MLELFNLPKGTGEVDAREGSRSKEAQAAARKAKGRDKESMLQR